MSILTMLILDAYLLLEMMARAMILASLNASKIYRTNYKHETTNIIMYIIYIEQISNHIYISIIIKFIILSTLPKPMMD
jgi:hypothetical protein